MAANTDRARATEAARKGEFDKAFGIVARLSGRKVRVPKDLSVFFPAEDGRQDLMYEQNFGLAPYEGEFRAARKAVLAAGLDRTGADLLTGYLDLFLGDYRRAWRSLARAAESADGYWPHFLHAAAIWLLGDRLRTRELLPDALEAIEKAVASDSGQLYAYVVRAGLRREMEDVPGRLADARRVCRMAPEFVWAHTELAEVLSEEGYYRPALKEANLLLKRYPKAAWAWGQRARMRGISGYYKLALADFDKAVALDPNCGPLYAWRGETKRRLGRHAEAIADQDLAIAKDPGYRLAYVWRGRIRLLLGEFRAAVRDFDAALRLEPREMLAQAWRGEAWWKLGEAEKAFTDFEAIFPAEPQGLWNARLKAGETQENYFLLDDSGGKRERSFWKDLDAVAAAGDKWALAFRGRCRVAGGRIEKGIADLDAAIRLDGRFALAYAWRGEARRRRGGCDRAISDFDRAVELSPKHLWSWARRGKALSCLGRRDEALGSFARLGNCREQRYALAFVWHGEALWAAGRREEAGREFRRAFHLDGKCAEAKEWLQKSAAPAAA